ncbi:uncharacterized protein METZ01_LOCUS3510 [marine metagenome]|uniref:Uncharacterized protein n=1 Tax=marine metagenome TaxID=408172 RepID=A0A381N7P7_9ZZZZ
MFSQLLLASRYRTAHYQCMATKMTAKHIFGYLVYRGMR